MEKEKLKTLKEMECGHVETNWMSGECIDGFIGVNKEELRAEAVKWVKINEKEIEEIEGKEYARQYTEMFMVFFNLTEEDLK